MDAISHGLGRSEDESSVSNLIRAGKVAFPSPQTPKFGLWFHSKEGRMNWRILIQDVYAANLLFLAGHGAAKISICFLLKQLGRQKGYLLCSKILLGIVTAWMYGSILAVAFSCFPQYQFSMAQHCTNIVRYTYSHRATQLTIESRVLPGKWSLHLMWLRISLPLDCVYYWFGGFRCGGSINGG